jgi:hypothetical protein
MKYAAPGNRKEGTAGKPGAVVIQLCSPDAPCSECAAVARAWRRFVARHGSTAGLTVRRSGSH